MWAAAASWLATVNLFNLFPISPLDGGRVTKALAFSFEKRVGFVLLGIGFALSIYLASKLHLSLLVFIGIIGLMEISFFRRIISSIVFFPFVLIFGIVVLIHGLHSNGNLDFGKFVELFENTIFNKDNFESNKTDERPWNLSRYDKVMFISAYCGMIILFLSVILMLHGPGSDLSKQLLQS
jgi:hypothetical protein